jgi:hypothetical protein
VRRPPETNTAPTAAGRVGAFAARKLRPGSPRTEGGAVAGSELIAAPDATLVRVFKNSIRAVHPHRVKARSCGRPDTLSGAKSYPTAWLTARPPLSPIHPAVGRGEGARALQQLAAKSLRTLRNCGNVCKRWKVVTTGIVRRSAKYRLETALMGFRRSLVRIQSPRHEGSPGP